MHSFAILYNRTPRQKRMYASHAIPRLTALQTLNIAGTNVSGRALGGLTKNSLTELNASSTPLSFNAIKLLAQTQTGLVSLNLSGTPLCGYREGVSMMSILQYFWPDFLYLTHSHTMFKSLFHFCHCQIPSHTHRHRLSLYQFRRDRKFTRLSRPRLAAPDELRGTQER